MRIALSVEYDGSHYHGFQFQAGLNTIQGAIEKALSVISGEPIGIVSCGRTDTGVHAVQHVLHFDSTKERAIRSWVYGVNTYLPKDIAVQWAKEVPETFHARHSAVARTYRYIIVNTPIRPALLRANVTWQYRTLDHEKMHEAGQALIGEHDFTSFRAAECQSRTPLRNVTELKVTRQGHMIIIDITANAFLHHMVRNIVGVLINVGSGKQEVSWVREVLAAKDRRLGAETAPPYGLYLLKIKYPQEFGVIDVDRTYMFF